jgi:hypothetical protein
MDLGPIEILYNWQSVLLAVGVSAAVQGVKRALDIALGGKDKRKAVRLVTQVLLPLLPLLLGSLGAILVPLHPEKLTEYVTSHANVKPWWRSGRGARPWDSSRTTCISGLGASWRRWPSLLTVCRRPVRNGGPAFYGRAEVLSGCRPLTCGQCLFIVQLL